MHRASLHLALLPIALVAPALAACSSGESSTGVGGSGGATSTSTTTATTTTTTSQTGSGGTSTGSTSQGGGGAATSCTPGEGKPCYTGPEGTQGVGACKAGVAICNPTGFGFGPCTDQVLPKIELCTTPEDEDCNGQANDGCVCEPFTNAPCYTGPPATMGVGTCKAGYQVCHYTGKMYGSCISEVLPGIENCASAADEDCDGTSPPCTGVHVSSKAFGGAMDEQGVALATDPDGNVFLVGTTTGTVDFGCGPLAGGAAPGGVIVKLAPGGACLWNKRYGDGVRIAGVRADISGNVYLGGTMAGTVDFGGGPLVSTGQSDVFFVKLDGAGAWVWSTRIGGTGAAVATGIAIDDTGTPVGIGHFHGAMDFGSGPVPSQGGEDIYVVKLSPSGTVTWARTFGDASDELGGQIAVDTGYGVIIAGTFPGTIDFGGGPLVSAGQGDVFVAKLDTGGDHVYSHAYGDAQGQSALAIGTDSLLNVYVAGAFDGTLDFGGASHTSAGGKDAWLLSLDTDGKHRWSKRFGDAGTQLGSALGVDGFGNVALGVRLQGAADFGGGALVSAGASDVAIAKYDPAGVFLWSKRFGGAQAEVPSGLAFARSGALYMTGVLNGPVDFGGGPVGGAGGEDVCLLQLAP